MPYDPSRHHRRSIRLKVYDYTQPGAYFITIVTHERAHLFGAVVDGEMRLNEWGTMVRDEWFKTAHIRPYVALYPDEFIVMPNHIHGIIWIVEPTDAGTTVGATRRVAPTITTRPRGPVPQSIGAMVGQFKSAVTKHINEWRQTPGAPVWQRNYYEHIIRDEHALHAIRRYIQENPRRWHLDRETINVSAVIRWCVRFGKCSRTTTVTMLREMPHDPLFRTSHRPEPTDPLRRRGRLGIPAA